MPKKIDVTKAPAFDAARAFLALLSGHEEEAVMRLQTAELDDLFALRRLGERIVTMTNREAERRVQEAEGDEQG